MEEDAWGFLGTHVGSQDNQIKEVLKDLSSVVSPLTWLQTPTADSVQLFKSMVGLNTNPFIRPSEAVSVEEFCANRRSLDVVSRLEVENLLRDVLIAKLDPVRSLVAILTLLNPDLLAKVKRTVVVSLESESDCKAWNSWKEFAGTRPEQYNEVQRRRAKEAFNAFWRVAEKLLKQVVLCLKEAVTDDDSQTDDVEKMLKRWREIPAYFRESSSWQDVLDRERVLFDTLSPKITIEWGTRSKHLMKLLGREEMGLTLAVIDSKLMELDEADGYDNWLTTVLKVFKLATIKVLTYKKKEKQTRRVIRSGKRRKQSETGITAEIRRCIFST